MFRFNLKNNTPLGQEAKKYIDKGQLVPDAVTINMLNAKVQENPDVKGYIFDGFPRTTPQAEALDELLCGMDLEVSKLVQLDVSEEEIVTRLLERGKTSGRSDDASEDTIRARYQEYLNKTAPVYDFYAQTAKSTKIDGIGSIDDIFGRLCAEVDAVA